MRVGVVMPARNAAAFVAEAVMSALEGGRDVRVVVVDDGSTDATAGIVGALAAADGRVTLVRGPGEGVAAARNRGIAALPDGCGLVSFLDADDMVPRGRWDADAAAFAADPALAVVYGRMRLVEDGAGDLRAAAGAEQLGISVSAGTYRAAAVRAVGAFDTAFVQSEDFDWLLRLFERRPVTQVVERVMILYRQHPGNTTKRRDEARWFFLRAMMEHARRRRADPALGAVDWVWGARAAEGKGG